MKLQGVGIRSLAAVARDPRQSTSEREHCLGLGTECTKASAAASGRRKMSLDIPFYRTSVWPTIRPEHSLPARWHLHSSRAIHPLNLLSSSRADSHAKLVHSSVRKAYGAPG